jgi:putative transposase
MGHKTYPYLLRGLEIERPNQVWCADLTYIQLAKGFLYLVAIMDWWSRKVLAWRLSNTMDVQFSVDAPDEALSRHGRPEIFNTDQGSQFTSKAVGLRPGLTPGPPADSPGGVTSVNGNPIGRTGL